MWTDDGRNGRRGVGLQREDKGEEQQSNHKMKDPIQS